MLLSERNRAELAAKGVDLDRVPPGQEVTDRFPVLQAGIVPEADLSIWDFTVAGLVDRPQTFDLGGFGSLPTTEIVADIHCVTKWSKLDTCTAIHFRNSATGVIEAGR